MAARGQEEKEQIKDTILKTFDGAFIDDKFIRVPINGLEIKITLTAAKDIKGGGAETQSSETQEEASPLDAVSDFSIEERQRVKTLLYELGIF